MKEKKKFIEQNKKLEGVGSVGNIQDQQLIRGHRVVAGSSSRQVSGHWRSMTIGLKECTKIPRVGWLAGPAVSVSPGFNRETLPQ